MVRNYKNGTSIVKEKQNIVFLKFLIVIILVYIDENVMENFPDISLVIRPSRTISKIIFQLVVSLVHRHDNHTMYIIRLSIIHNMQYACTYFIDGGR